MNRFLVVSIFVCLACVAYGQDILIPSTMVMREQLDNRSTPTDIIFKNSDDWLLYSAVEGRITEYKENRAVKIYESQYLKDGICFVELDRSIYFCDSKNRVLRQLNTDYTLIRTISAAPGRAPFDPTDIVKGNTYLYFVVDNDNHRILLMTPQNGDFTGQWGQMGYDRGMLRYPFSAVFDNANLLYVTEVLNTRVQMFAPTGRSTLEIGSWGVEPGQLYRPKGLALMHNKYLIVSDGYLGVLQIFDVYGTFIGVVADEQGNIRRYSSPTRIRAYGDRLAVLDYYDNLFEVITIQGLK